jgi:hypothetical protein
MLLFATSFSTSRSAAASFHEFATIQEAKQSKAKQRKEKKRNTTISTSTIS